MSKIRGPFFSGGLILFSKVKKGAGYPLPALRQATTNVAVLQRRHFIREVLPSLHGLPLVEANISNGITTPFSSRGIRFNRFWQLPC